MNALNLAESLKTIKKYGIHTTEFWEATDEKQALFAAQQTGFPAAMKIVSTKINHKSDAGAVKLNLKNAEETTRAFSELSKLEGFEGVIVQPMVFGTEIIIGGKQDEQFGPTILFGLGGIFVEVFKDYSIRICPITKKDAKEMIAEIKGLPLLLGARGRPKANLAEIENTLLKVSKMLLKEKQIRELDINPLMATPDGVTAVDARIIL